MVTAQSPEAARNVFRKEGAAKRAKDMDTELRGAVPLDPEVVLASDAGRGRTSTSTRDRLRQSLWKRL